MCMYSSTPVHSPSHQLSSFCVHHSLNIVNQNVEMIQEMILNVAIEYVVNHKVDKFMACGSCTAQVMAMNKRLE